jgi:5-methylcytosine-specific restriction endonuclease McrA
VLEYALNELVKKSGFLSKSNDRSKIRNHLPPTSKVTLVPAKRPYISKHIKQEVWKNSRARCSYKSSSTQKRCESKRFLELDHINPVSKGGVNTIENLQLLCDVHNRLKGAT